MINYQKFLKEIDTALSKDNNYQREANLIRRFVGGYRERYGITPVNGRKSELSCIAFGEDFNLLYTQLVSTKEGDGGWEEIKDKKVRRLVLKRIKKDIALELRTKN